MEDESVVTRSIIDDLNSSDIQGVELEGESSVTRSIIDELHSWDIKGDQIEAESMVLLKEPWMKFVLRIS